MPYDGDVWSMAPNLLEGKVLLNSTISYVSKGARFMTVDIKDYFLATPMVKLEYVKLRYKHITQDIKDKHKLHDKVTNNEYVYIKIKRARIG